MVVPLFCECYTCTWNQHTTSEQTLQHHFFGFGECSNKVVDLNRFVTGYQVYCFLASRSTDHSTLQDREFHKLLLILDPGLKDVGTQVKVDHPNMDVKHQFFWAYLCGIVSRAPPLVVGCYYSWLLGWMIPIETVPQDTIDQYMSTGKSDADSEFGDDGNEDDDDQNAKDDYDQFKAWMEQGCPSEGIPKSPSKEKVADAKPAATTCKFCKRDTGCNSFQL